jgi:hypothetical protein
VHNPLSRSKEEEKEHDLVSLSHALQWVPWVFLQWQTPNVDHSNSANTIVRSNRNYWENHVNVHPINPTTIGKIILNRVNLHLYEQFLNQNIHQLPKHQDIFNWFMNCLPQGSQISTLSRRAESMKISEASMEHEFVKEQKASRSMHWAQAKDMWNCKLIY